MPLTDFFELTADQIHQYHHDGYLIVRALISTEEVDAINAHFLAMHDNPPRDHYQPLDSREAGGDPLKMYPRIMQPHRWDNFARRYLLDSRIWSILQQLLGEEPVAAQSMYYFKPAGARGQALHQDNFYLNVKPGTCIAAWIALDRCDSDNGGLQVIPHTQNIEVVCPEKSDADLSFSPNYVAPPPGAEPVSADMGPGDVLFFNGNVIHGSLPNRSATRWRRSYICHYMADSDREIAQSYFPLMNADGHEVLRAVAPGGGPCGGLEG